MRVRLNSFGAHGVPGDVVDLDDGLAAPLLAGGGAHPPESDPVAEGLLVAGLMDRDGARALTGADRAGAAAPGGAAP